MPTAAFGHALAGCGKGGRFCAMLSSIRRQLEGAVPRSLSALSTNQHLGEATRQGRAGELPPDYHAIILDINHPAGPLASAASS